MKTILVNKPTSTMTPNPKRKSLLARLEEKADALGKKIEQSAEKAKEAANKAVDGVMRAAIAGTNAIVDASEGKVFEDIVENAANIYQTDSAAKAALKMADVRLGGHTREAARMSAEVTTASQTAYPLMHLNRIMTFSIPPKRDDSNARKYVRFAAHVYGGYSSKILPYGCCVLEEKKTLEGLKAKVYSDGSDIVCAFAGSETLKDWENDITQLVGLSLQYEQALTYGKELKEKYDPRNIVFVGHSQGGGEAAYCAYNLGLRAETYNPAGLSLFTRLKHKTVSREAKINAYVFSTDILNFFQTKIGVFAGSIRADGNIHYISDANMHDHGMHGIEGILRYFEIDY